MENRDTGLLLNKHNILLQRKYFVEMTHLLGIQVVYRAPKEDKHWDEYGELDSYYQAPQVVGCIFDEHPDQKTMKKMGWVAELQEGSSIIHVPYDLKDLQVGALFIIPSAIDNSVGRLFRVTTMSVISVYPASIACEVRAVYKNDTEAKSTSDFTNTNFNLLKEE